MCFLACCAACKCCKCCVKLWVNLIECVGKLMAHVIVGLISLIILGGFVVLILWLCGVIDCGPSGCDVVTQATTTVASTLAGQMNPKFRGF